MQVADERQREREQGDQPHRLGEAERQHRRGAAEQRHQHRRPPADAIGHHAAGQPRHRAPRAVQGHDRAHHLDRQAAHLGQVQRQENDDEAPQSVDQRADPEEPEGAGKRGVGDDDPTARRQSSADS